MGVKVRKARAEDIDDIINLHLLSDYEDTESSQEISPLSALMIKAYVVQNISHIYVTEENGVIVARTYAKHQRKIRYISLNDEAVSITSAFISDQFTMKEHRGRGICSKILDQIEKDVRNNPDINELYVSVENNDMIDFWKTRGYEQVGKGCASCSELSYEYCIIPVYRRVFRNI